MVLARLPLLGLVAVGLLLAPAWAGGAQLAAAGAAARPLRRPAPLHASLKTDDGFGSAREVEVPSVPLGVSAEGMIGQARAGQTADGAAPGGSTRSSLTKGLTRGQPQPRPQVDKAHLDKLHEEFLGKPADVVERNIKDQTAGSVAARIATAADTRTPPDDYYMCAQVYIQELGQRTPLIHSLCTWWVQTREDAPEPLPPAQSALTDSQGLMCKQIRKPRQCYRFDGDPFLQHPRLNDFTKHCTMNCLGKMTAGSREGVGGGE
eukprot:COSAG02_NODE_266_length_26580_cov_9.209207_5_plen_263_part_00